MASALPSQENRTIFIDTNEWFARVVPSDQSHYSSVVFLRPNEIARSINQAVFTSKIGVTITLQTGRAIISVNPRHSSLKASSRIKLRFDDPFSSFVDESG